MNKLGLLVLLFCAFESNAQYDDALENKVFYDDVETVILQKEIDIYDPVPIITLGTTEQLRLSFDQLKAQNEYFNYTFIHCDRNWVPTDMAQMDYINGNLFGDIERFTYSTNTYTQYTHYSLVFPNDRMEITRSGNYILKVYRNFNEEDVVLYKRFMVVDHQTKVAVDVKTATLAEYRFSHQEVDVEVDYADYIIPNPFIDIDLTILQNNSWNNAIYGLKPQFVNGNKLMFNYEEENIFPGTNEFRFFDLRTLRFNSTRIIKKFMDSSNVINVQIEPDELRSHLRHTAWIDYNGKRVIKNKDGVNIAEDGDYAKVYFYLKSQDKSHIGDVYVFGELTDWQLKDEFKMKYWPDYDMYSTSALLKQSFYDYMYVLKDKDGNIDYSFTEGNHQETENDYLILVYHRNVAFGYDEIIGMTTQNSTTINPR